MKKKKVAIILSLLLLFIISSTIIQAQGAESYNITITPTKQQLLPGDEITVVFQLENIQEELGIGAVFGKLEYDKKIFKKVVPEDFIKAEGWEVPMYNSENESEGNLFLLTETGESAKETTKIFTIKMKVLEEVPSKNTQIKLTNISSSNGEKDLETQDVSVDFTVEGNMTILDSVWFYVGIIVAIAVVIIGIIMIRKKQQKR